MHKFTARESAPGSGVWIVKHNGAAIMTFSGEDAQKNAQWVAAAFVERQTQKRTFGEGMDP